MVAGALKLPHVWRLSMTRIKRAIERRGLPVETVVRDGREMLVYATAYKAEFLRLFSDDYLSSPMTLLEYEVSAKRAVKPGPGKIGQAANLRLLDGTKLPTLLRGQPAHIPDVSAESLRDLADVDQ